MYRALLYSVGRVLMTLMMTYPELDKRLGRETEKFVITLETQTETGGRIDVWV